MVADVEEQEVIANSRYAIYVYEIGLVWTWFPLVISACMHIAGIRWLRRNLYPSTYVQRPVCMHIPHDWRPYERGYKRVYARYSDVPVTPGVSSCTGSHF
jgi:hypothetical protein